MAKAIKLTQEYIDALCEDFRKTLTETKMSDGKVTYTKSFSDEKCKATVLFEEIAWLKMQTLIQEFDKEVAWHGIAKRGDDPEANEYIISDILVYPQEITGTTVDAIEEEYSMWLVQQPDEVFHNLRMQGHSHVNMGTTPSGTDNTMYSKILDQMSGDTFYIFMIWNKRGEKTIKIYDLQKNLLFETADCTVEIIDGGLGMQEFIDSAKEMIRTKTYTYAKQTTNIVPAATTTVSTKPAAAPAGSSVLPVITPKKEEKETKRKGKRKDKNKSEKPKNAWHSPYYTDDFEDDDDPYGPFGYSSGYYNSWR